MLAPVRVSNNIGSQSNVTFSVIVGECDESYILSMSINLQLLKMIFRDLYRVGKNARNQGLSIVSTDKEYCHETEDNEQPGNHFNSRLFDGSTGH